jgi:hypothetical protein
MNCGTSHPDNNRVHRPKRFPEVGCMNPSSKRISVDFPAPLGPSKPKTSPAQRLEGCIGLVQ